MIFPLFESVKHTVEVPRDVELIEQRTSRLITFVTIILFLCLIFRINLLSQRLICLFDMLEGLRDIVLLACELYELEAFRGMIMGKFAVYIMVI